jgi:hypothetical protein
MRKTILLNVCVTVTTALLLFGAWNAWMTYQRVNALWQWAQQVEQARNPQVAQAPKPEPTKER